jgi:YHS domain-containing protein
MAFRMMVVLVFSLVSGIAAAAQPPVFSDAAGAIRGHDPVAYFERKAPVKGSRQFAHEWNGATWYFSSAVNRDRFAAAPEKYAPRYGGYCAYGVAQGYAPEIDPNAWAVVDGRLYLNFSRDVQQRWSKDIPGYIRKANANWPAVLKE